MATTTGPDLSAAVEAVEALMDDECVITRDLNGDEDAVLDTNPLSPTYGQLVDPTDNTAVYDGRCLLKAPAGLVNRPVEQGGRIYTQGDYELRLPITAMIDDPSQEPQKGDKVVMSDSRRDPEVIGLAFRITDVTYGTIAIQRICSLERQS